MGAAALLVACAVSAAGCSRLVGSMAADTLSAAILNQDDPQLVEEGVPAYLLLVDGLIHENPGNEDLLAAAAQLYALYGARFAADAQRGATLTAKAREYGQQAMCLSHEPACAWNGLSYQDFTRELADVGRRDVDYLYAYGVSWLSHLEATSADWTAVAELPWVEAALERALALDEAYEAGALHGYLGTLHVLRPPAYGGEPEVAREHFERAIELSEGRDLSIKVEYARRYARMVFDQALHDRLLEEVLAASAQAPGLTLFNTLAQREARELLASSAEYF